MAIQVARVRPGRDEIERGAVACWDQDPAHLPIDPLWQEFGGAHVVGDPANPEREYLVAPTPGVEFSIRQGRLVLVGMETWEPAEPEPEAPARASRSKKKEDPPAEPTV